ncbi:flagellar associated protein, partial [Monoraphidium neglectum]
MSRIYSAGQYQQTYLPHRLNNWMAPDNGKQHATTAPGRYGTLRAKPPGSRTQFIVDKRGHLLPGVPKANTAFSSGAEALGGVPPRWPSPSPALLAAPAATMGYKGIQTDYLPSSTVITTSVQLE